MKIDNNCFSRSTLNSLYTRVSSKDNETINVIPVNCVHSPKNYYNLFFFGYSYGVVNAVTVVITKLKYIPDYDLFNGILLKDQNASKMCIKINSSRVNDIKPSTWYKVDDGYPTSKRSPPTTSINNKNLKGFVSYAVIGLKFNSKRIDYDYFERISSVRSIRLHY